LLRKGKGERRLENRSPSRSRSFLLLDMRFEPQAFIIYKTLVLQRLFRIHLPFSFWKEKIGLQSATHKLLLLIFILI
jgi:hypothetical protein